ISFAGLEVDPYATVRTLGAGERRLVEVARAVVGRPRLVLLDEPAAGLPDEETSHLADVIRRIPDRTGALATLVLAVGGVLRPKAGAVLLDDSGGSGASASTELTGRRPERIRQAGVAI